MRVCKTNWNHQSTEWIIVFNNRLRFPSFLYSNKRLRGASGKRFVSISAFNFQQFGLVGVPLGALFCVDGEEGSTLTSEDPRRPGFDKRSR